MDFWIGIQDPKNSGKKESWKDVYTGESIGYTGVPRGDHFFIYDEFFALLVLKLSLVLKLISRLSGTFPVRTKCSKVRNKVVP